MRIDRTFVMIKPDAVQRGLVGEILHRFERRGMKIVAMKMVKINDDMAATHYAEHQGKKFYERLMRYITSGPVIVLVVEALDAVQQVRRMVGSTLPSEAEVGTIRADYAQELPLNIIHASDSTSSAQKEIELYFSEDEVLDYELSLRNWILSFEDME